MAKVVDFNKYRVDNCYKVDVYFSEKDYVYGIVKYNSASSKSYSVSARKVGTDFKLLYSGYLQKDINDELEQNRSNKFNEIIK